MDRGELLEKFEGGFTVDFYTGSRWDYILTEEWILNRDGTDEDNLRFWGYDANLCPMKDFSTRKDKCCDEVVNKALKITKNINVNVWLDDVKIKSKVTKVTP